MSRNREPASLAILRLHMAQEEELYVSLGDEHPEVDEAHEPRPTAA